MSGWQPFNKSLVNSFTVLSYTPLPNSQLKGGGLDDDVELLTFIEEIEDLCCKSFCKYIKPFGKMKFDETCSNKR